MSQSWWDILETRLLESFKKGKPEGKMAIANSLAGMIEKSPEDIIILACSYAQEFKRNEEGGMPPVEEIGKLPELIGKLELAEKDSVTSRIRKSCQFGLAILHARLAFAHSRREDLTKALKYFIEGFSKEKSELHDEKSHEKFLRFDLKKAFRFGNLYHEKQFIVFTYISECMKLAARHGLFSKSQELLVLVFNQNILNIGPASAYFLVLKKDDFAYLKIDALVFKPILEFIVKKGQYRQEEVVVLINSMYICMACLNAYDRLLQSNALTESKLDITKVCVVTACFLSGILKYIQKCLEDENSDKTNDNLIQIDLLLQFVENAYKILLQVNPEFFIQSSKSTAERILYTREMLTLNYQVSKQAHIGLLEACDAKQEKQTDRMRKLQKSQEPAGQQEFKQPEHEEYTSNISKTRSTEEYKPPALDMASDPFTTAENKMAPMGRIFYFAEFLVRKIDAFHKSLLTSAILKNSASARAKEEDAITKVTILLLDRP